MSRRSCSVPPSWRPSRDDKMPSTVSQNGESLCQETECYWSPLDLTILNANGGEDQQQPPRSDSDYFSTESSGSHGYYTLATSNSARQPEEAEEDDEKESYFHEGRRKVSRRLQPHANGNDEHTSKSDRAPPADARDVVRCLREIEADSSSCYVEDLVGEEVAELERYGIVPIGGKVLIDRSVMSYVLRAEGLGWIRIRVNDRWSAYRVLTVEDSSVVEAVKREGQLNSPWRRFRFQD